MPNPISLPRLQPPPEQEVYTTEVLGLFKEYDRASYLASFGVEAPAWDPKRARKTWFDSSVSQMPAGAVVTYSAASQDAKGLWALRKLSLNAGEASTLNLPGGYYPPYTVAPTKATERGATVDASSLSMEADARTLMNELNGAALIDQGSDVLYPSDEARRMWGFNYGKPVRNEAATQASRLTPDPRSVTVAEFGGGLRVEPRVDSALIGLLNPGSNVQVVGFVNSPGFVQYSPFKGETDAWWVTADGRYLSAVLTVESPGVLLSQAPGEGAGAQLNAGILLAAKYSKGVGRPGHWDESKAVPSWVSDLAPVGSDDSRPPVAMPLRDLLPQEELQSGPMGGLLVKRKDLEEARMAETFTSADRKVLRDILDAITRLVPAG